MSYTKSSKESLTQEGNPEQNNAELEKIRNKLREAKSIDREIQREFLLKKSRLLEEQALASNFSRDELIKKAISLKTKSLMSCESLNGIMNSLLDNPDNVTAFLSVDGALQSLLRALSGQNEKYQLLSARCICNLALGNEKQSMQVLRASESYLFAHLSGKNQYIMEASAIAVGNFSRHGPKHIQLLIDNGFFSKITNLLESSNENLEVSAIYALTQLIYHGFDLLTEKQIEDSILACIPIFIKKSYSIIFLMSLLSASKCHLDYFMINKIHMEALKYLLISLQENEKDAVYYLRIISNCISQDTGRMASDLVQNHKNVLRQCVRLLLNSKKQYLKKECLNLVGNILNHEIEAVRLLAMELVKDNYNQIRLLMESTFNISEMEESSEDLEDLDVMCSLYISPMTDPEQFIKSTEDDHATIEQSLTTKQLQNLLKSYQLIGKWNILKTTCGFLISFTNELDADKVVSNNLAAVFGPMQIVRLHGRRSFLRQAVFLREVPWAIQLNDLKEALIRQGITSARVERKRHHVRVEVCEPEHYETLLRRGLNFFGAIRFQAIPDRGIRSHYSWHDPSSTLSSDPNFVLQCYRCQGFWHIAANCRHEVRCVRCGDHHSVQFCPRPRSDPVCCHCSGPHHAAYRFCPVRLDLVNAVPVSLTLTTRRAPNRYLPYPRN